MKSSVLCSHLLLMKSNEISFLLEVLIFEYHFVYSINSSYVKPPTLLRFLHALPAFLQSPRYFISSVMADLEVSWPEKSKSRISTIFFSDRNLLSRANVTKDLVYVRHV